VAELEVRDLTVEFNASGGYVLRPLDGLSFDADDGELVVVLGPSGSGKTTLLSCLAGLLTPKSGTVRFRGREVTALGGQARAAYRRHTVGVVFQAFNLIPSLSARGNVRAPLRLAGVPRRRAQERAESLLGMVGLSDRLGHRPAQLSGGQQQRVAIARALVHDPPLVIADEPTAHLDYVQVESTLRLIRTLAEPGRLVLVATHDERITNIADRVIDLAPHGVEPVEDAEQVTLDAGDVLFEQGDPACIVYLIEEGAIEIYRPRPGGGEEQLVILEPGQYFGELGPLLNLPRSASARALTPARLTGMSVSAFKARVPAPAVSACADPLAAP
jgi:putative ABC transport system ATP-binding protein